MNYHLNQQGQDIGAFSLEELCRRRQAGELSGAELIWCEGMTQWQPLDLVLHREMPGVVPVPPPIPPPKSKSARAVKTVAVLLLGLVAMACFGFVAMKTLRLFQTTLRRVGVGYGGMDGGAALDLASRPVRWTTNTLTVAKGLETAGQFRIRQYVEGYEKYGEHNSSYDVQASGLLKNWVAANYHGTMDTNLPSLTELSNKLLRDLDCNDPVVLTVAAQNTIELHETIHRLERAVSAFEHSRYPAYPRVYATVNLADRLGHGSGRVPALDASAKQLLKQAFQDGSILPEDQAEIADIMVVGWGDSFFHRNGAAVVSIAQAQGSSFEWLALVLEARHHHLEAWKARGDGYANTVSQEGWKTFYDQLSEARECYTKAWKLRPDLRLAPEQMVFVALGDGGLAEMRQWFDRTVAIEIDNHEVWKELRWGLRPRWHGNLDAMLAFGVTAVNTRRFDTGAPRNLFDTVSDLEAELKLPLGEHIYKRADIWPHVQEMYEGYIAEPSQPKDRDGWRSTYAAVAYLAGKYDVSRTQLEAIQWKPARWNLSGWGADLSILPLEVAARTSLIGQQIGRAEVRRRNGAITEAVRLYTDLAATNSDERTRAFIHDRLTTLDLERRLQTGDWVDFLPVDKDLPGWYVERGQCTPLPEGGLEVQSGEGGHLLYSRARVGLNFEVRGSFEVVRSSTSAFQAGLVMGIPEFDGHNWFGFRVKRNADEGDVVSFAPGWGLDQQISHTTTLDGHTNTFDFRFQSRRVSALVNNQEIIKDTAVPGYTRVSDREFLLGLGAFNDMNDTVIRYHSVQVRELPPR